MMKEMLMNMNNGIINNTMANVLSETGIQTTMAVNIQSTQPSFDYDVDNLTLIYGPKRDPLYVVIPITFIYMVIFVSGVIGNISTCIVIAKNRSMHTATNYYLFSLAVSDFLLLISGVPQEVYSIWSKYPYVFGEVFCVVRGLMAETSANATVLTITSFTVERYLAICHPFLQHTISKLSRAIRLILVVWIVSIFLAIPQALQFGVITDDNGIEHCVLKRIIIKHSFELSTLLFFVTPMTLITVLYILIGLKLRTSGLIKHENGVSMQRRVNSCRQQTSMGTRRVLKMLVAVVVAFCICWAPFHAQRLVAFYGNDHVLIYAIMTYISGILYYLSTCINPLLYNIMSNKFREAFKETLAKCCQLQKRRYDKDSTYRVLSRRQRRWNANQESGDYSGSSVRDESMYSAVTQKQSFDSMTLSQCQSFKLPNHGPINFHTNAIDPFEFSARDGNGHINNSVQRVLNKTQAELMNVSDENVTFMHDKTKEIRISISCAKKIKLNSDSRWSEWIQNLFRLRNSSRNIGYYSPPMDHPIGKINIRLNTVAAASDTDINKYKQPNGTQTVGICNNKVKQLYDGDDDSISNSSLKDVSPTALEDELSSYMEELRLRELR